MAERLLTRSSSIADGLPSDRANFHAADQMIVSVNTVRKYIRSIYDKLHVHSRSAAVTRALRAGLI